MQMIGNEANDSPTQATNGIPADLLPAARWRKSARSNPTGACVELAELPDGQIAVRNSRFPGGPALIYPKAAVAALVSAAGKGRLNALSPRYCEETG
jgi:hypothetical protein